LHLILFARGDWKDLQFKEYNFSAKGLPAEGGYLHPLLKARFQFFSFSVFFDVSMILSCCDHFV